MSETTGSATDFEDLMSDFLTWATGTPGWTLDEGIGTVDTGRQCALSKGTCFVQFRWATTMGTTAAMYQSTGYTGGNRAGTMPGDSGNGFNSSNSTTNANLASERCLHLINNGPYPSYYFYTNGSGDYLHVAVEVATGDWLHFGMATDILKFGDWDTGSGGAYAYGMPNRDNISSTNQSQSWLLDGGSATVSGGGDQRLKWATMRMAGMPGQGGSEVWATIGGSKSHTQQNDTAGNARAIVIGGFRGGPVGRAFGDFPAGTMSGLAPLTPTALFLINRATTPDYAYLLGFQEDVRLVDLTYMAPKDTFTLGGDTWRVFPSTRRASGATAGNSDFQGVAYKV